MSKDAVGKLILRRMVGWVFLSEGMTILESSPWILVSPSVQSSFLRNNSGRPATVDGRANDSHTCRTTGCKLSQTKAGIQKAT